MKSKKRVITIVIAILFIMASIMQNMIYATTLPDGQEVYMGITELMTDNMGYAINTPGAERWFKNMEYFKI